MIRKHVLSMTTLALLVAGPLAAQETAMEPEQDPMPEATQSAAQEATEEAEQEATQQVPEPAAQQPVTHDHSQESMQEAPPQAAEQAAVQAGEQASEQASKPDAPPASGQQQMTPEMQQMMEAYQKAGAPGAEHQRMADMAGTYDMTIKSWHGPEPTTDTGTATRKMILGDRVMVEEVTSQMMGQPFTGHGLSGYDNVSDKYWATWIDSMSTGVMTSEGTCDANMACTYTGTYNDAMSGQPKTVRMTSRWTDDSTEVFEMYGPGPDGKEMKMMEITYKKGGS